MGNRNSSAKNAKNATSPPPPTTTPSNPTPPKDTPHAAQDSHSEPQEAEAASPPPPPPPEAKKAVHVDTTVPAPYLAKAVGMVVYVAQLEGDTIPIEVGPQWTVGDLYDATQDATKSVSFTLSLANNTLTDRDMSLADAGLSAEVVISFAEHSEIPRMVHAGKALSISDDARTITHKSSAGNEWTSASSEVFHVGHTFRVNAVVLEPMGNENIMVGVREEGLNTNIYPRDPKKGMWYVMLCWGGAVFYNGDKQSTTHFKIVKDDQVTVSLDKEGVISFNLKGEQLCPPTILPRGGAKGYEFFVAMYERGAIIHLEPPGSR
eukprot:Hpha_TRINITY_DN12250_c0_g1::TRINITY_DN12250_c0_g1_i1::g.17067::m.17067